MSNDTSIPFAGRPDYVRSQGSAALGAHLRRLSEKLDRDAAKLYIDANIPFEQRWVSPMKILALYGPLSVGELATHLGVTHVSVSQTRQSMEKAGLLVSMPDQNDARVRRVKLTSSGQKLLRKLEPLWKVLEDVSRELDKEAGQASTTLSKLDEALERSSLYERVTERLGSTSRLRSSKR